VQPKSRRRKARLGSLATVLALAVAAGGCGFSSEEGGGGGGTTLNWYVFNEPGGGFVGGIENCNKEAAGRYRINYVRLPTNADQQRELVARRLAAEDSDIDIIGLDVNWTAEFAEAGWIKEWTGERASRAAEGKLAAPLRTTKYQDRTWAIPLTSNTQLLWYRKDRVKQVPETWDEMIDQAKQAGRAIEVQAARYEGYTVWINSLVASAGGQIVDEEGNVKVDRTTQRAAEIIKRVATEAAPPGMSNNQEDQARLGFESGRSDFQVNYPFIFASAAEVPGGFQKKIAWARYPSVEKGQPSRVTVGGINLGIGAYSKNPDLAFDAAECLARPENQIVYSEKGGLPPTTEALYDDPRYTKANPFADALRESLDGGVARPVTPAYTDISLAIQKSFHPPENLDPAGVTDDLKDKLDKAAEGKIF
jgi:multiple sugar transport system substrate-binding protein